MTDTMGIILTRDSDKKLYDLTEHRAVAAVPFGGRYRIIDFIMSCMVNSGISNIGVVTHSDYQSLMDHLGSGKEWDLDRKLGGLFIFPPNNLKGSDDSRRGSLDDLHSLRHYFRRSKERYVVVAESGMICNAILDDAMDYHLSHEADITIFYNKVDTYKIKELTKFAVIDVNDNGQVVGLDVNPLFPRTGMVSMKMFITNKALLETLVDECYAQGYDDFEADALRRNLGNLRVFGYEYNGYVARIDTVRSYYKNNMALLDREVLSELFTADAPVYTKVKDEVPSMYGDHASVENSLIADGCVIEGSVRNSILFRGVQVSKNAVISDSIIMQNSEVHEDSELAHVILDKDVIVRVGKRLTGQADYPVLIAKNGVI